MKNLKCHGVLFLLSMGVLSVGADVIEISGSVDRKAYTRRNAMQFQHSERFHAWLTSNQYCFRYIGAGVGTVSEDNYDGNIYKTTWFRVETNSDGTVISDAVSNPDYYPKTSVYPAMVTVATNAIPDGYGSPEAYLWMAFYGRDYLATNKNVIPPIWIPSPVRTRDMDYTLAAITENIQNEDYRIFYLNDGYARSEGLGNRPVIERLNPPFEKGYTNLIFLAENVTNICGVPIFLKSSFKNYALDRNTKEPYLRLLFEINVSSVKVAKHDFDTNRFFQGESQVHDQRLPVVEATMAENSYFTNAFAYQTTNSGILYGVELTNLYQARLREVKEIAEEMRKIRNKQRPNEINNLRR